MSAAVRVQVYAEYAVLSWPDGAKWNSMRFPWGFIDAFDNTKDGGHFGNRRFPDQVATQLVSLKGMRGEKLK